MAFISLAMMAQSSCAFASNVTVDISVNGGPIDAYGSFERYAYLYVKDGWNYSSGGQKFPISPAGRVEFEMPDDKMVWVLRTSLPGGLTPVYSPPLKAGRNLWDIKAAKVSVKSGRTGKERFEGREVSLFKPKGKEYINLWKKVKVLPGDFFIMALPDDGGAYVAGIDAGGGVMSYSNQLKAGEQAWDLTKNRPPVLADIPEQTVEEGGRLVVAVSARDIDNDPISLRLSKKTDFTIFRDWKDNSGAIVLRPVDGDAGAYKVRVRAGDGKAFDEKEFTITVKRGAAIKKVTKPRIDPLPLNPPVLDGSGLTAIWANDGGDKVTRDELRATRGIDTRNGSWDGSSVKLFGARNEVISFNVVLEAGRRDVSGISVELDKLEGPGGSVIASRRTDAGGVFDFTGREIELFYVRYLQIRGLSRLAYEPSYDERHVPLRLQLPYALPKGTSWGTFEQRSDANKYYPDIAVPMEAVPEFGIKRGENQSVWVDVYIPKGSRAGMYRGEMRVFEDGKKSVAIPVSLEVLPFSLPDEPSAKTMVYFSEDDINDRYLGVKWPDMSKETAWRNKFKERVWKRHHLLAHRHKLSLIDDGTASINDMQKWVPVLSGDLFTHRNGYDGPGTGVSSGVYSIGTYGSWRHLWDEGSEKEMHENSDRWVKWFDENFPKVEYFLYLTDEPGREYFAFVERWASWIKENPGLGRRLQTLVTSSIVKADRYMPSVDIGFAGWGDTEVWRPVVDKYRKNGKLFWSYNGMRVASGSFMIEDEGVSLRVLGWTHFKHRVGRWFYWQSTHYKNSSHVSVETNVFERAWTFGRIADRLHPKFGETGQNYMNGDGVLFYPGTDRRYPEDSYGLEGPIASLRMKHWRRGIQDIDYLAMASRVDPEAVESLVNGMIPKVLWEIGVTDPADPSYVHTDISWPIDPDEWEKARRALAEIIMGGL